MPLYINIIDGSRSFSEGPFLQRKRIYIIYCKLLFPGESPCTHSHSFRTVPRAVPSEITRSKRSRKITYVYPKVLFSLFLGIPIRAKGQIEREKTIIYHIPQAQVSKFCDFYSQRAYIPEALQETLLFICIFFTGRLIPLVK